MVGDLEGLAQFGHQRMTGRFAWRCIILFYTHRGKVVDIVVAFLDAVLSVADKFENADFCR